MIAGAGAGHVLQPNPLRQAARRALKVRPLVVAHAREALAEVELIAVWACDTDGGGGVIHVVRHRREDDDGELEPLRLMDRHEPHGIVIADIRLGQRSACRVGLHVCNRDEVVG